MVDRLTEAAVEAIRPHLPEQDRAEGAVVLDVGFASVVARFGSSVVRIARNDDAARGHAREEGTVATLAGKLPVAVAAPSRQIGRSPSLPHGAVLQPLLPGRTMAWNDAVEYPGLIDDIAELLAVLHRIAPSAFPEGSLWILDPTHELDQLDAATSDHLRGQLTPAERARLDRLVTQARADLPGRDRVVCHADAWYGNLLVDGGRLTGLLDLEHACVADPALDLAAQTYLEAPTANAVIDAYEERAGALADRDARIRGYLLFRELVGLAYVVQNDIREEFDHASAGITALLD